MALEIQSQTKVIEVTPTMDTSAYASGDYAGTVMTLANAARAPGLGGVLQTLALVDKADQGAAMTLHFFSQLPTITSADNAAIDITDANAAYYIGSVAIATADYYDFGGNKNAAIKNIGLAFRPDPTAPSTVQNIYAIIVMAGSATYAASSLTFKFGILQD